MFRFNFVDAESKEITSESVPDNNKAATIATATSVLALSDLLNTLPETLLAERLDLSEQTKIWRRDYSDIKFQLAQEDPLDDGMDYGVEEESDVVLGKYEGGFKTWECSLDLTRFLESFNLTKVQHCLELGCGSALPSISLFKKGLIQKLDVQDFNASVLRLCTLPNLLINLCCSSPEQLQQLETQQQGQGLDKFQEFEINNSLKETFPKDRVRFIAGSWDQFIPDVDGYDLILASETIYHAEHHQLFYETLRKSLKKPHGLVLLAVKTIYFGCTGDLWGFLKVVEKQGEMKITRKWQSTSEMKREIIQLEWAPL